MQKKTPTSGIQSTRRNNPASLIRNDFVAREYSRIRFAFDTYSPRQQTQLAKASVVENVTAIRVST